MKYFDIEELVAPEILSVLCDKAAWRLIPMSVRRGLDLLRSIYGQPIYINGNGNHYCGVRPKHCIVGALESRHKLVIDDVCAFDLHSDSLDVLRSVIMEHHKTLGIIRIEHKDYTPRWIHIEFGEADGNLVIFKS